MEMGIIKINNEDFAIKKPYNEKIQENLDEIIILSKMIDKVYNSEFIFDEHPSFLNIIYVIDFNGLYSVKLKFSTHHDYSYDEVKYIPTKKIHCLTFSLPVQYSDIFNVNNKNIQYRGLGEFKTTNLDAMVEMLEEVKNFIIIV